MSYIFVLLSQAARLISALNLLQRRAGNNRCKTSLQRLLYQMLAEAQLSIEEPWKVAFDFGGAMLVSISFCNRSFDDVGSIKYLYKLTDYLAILYVLWTRPGPECFVLVIATTPVAVACFFAGLSSTSTSVTGRFRFFLHFFAKSFNNSWKVACIPVASAISQHS